MCGGQCSSSDCNNSTCLVGCTSYCLHNSCNFNCGGDETIEISSTNCNGLCTSSSCSATGWEYNSCTRFSFYIIYVYILYIWYKEQMFI